MAQNPFEQALVDEGLVGTPLESLARSIYQQESSGGKNTKTSNAGAVGGMQILPSTFSQYNPQGNISNPYDNAVGGLRYIKDLYNKTGDLNLTAVGYYGGPGGIDKAKRGVAVSDPRNPQAPNTLEYAKQVLARTGDKVSRGTNPEAVIADAGQGYQAAYALMAMADEEETDREREAREEKEATAEAESAAEQFAQIQKQLASVKLASPFAAQEPVERAQGSPEQGEVAQNNQSSGGYERWIADKIGLGQAWDTSLAVPKEYGYTGDSGTAGDAMRHMTLMREISKKYGETPARLIGYAHEYIGGPMQYFSSGEPQSSRDREMDIRNNALGLELSKRAKDDQDFIRLVQDAIKNKQADYYRDEYTDTRPSNAGGMGLKKAAAGRVRKRAGGSPEEGEVAAEPSLKETAATMLASLKNPEHWKELGAGMKRAATATPGVVESVGRGAIATVPGTPGDIESLIRMGTGGKQVLPTTEDLLKRTDQYRMFSKPEGAEDLEMVGGWISPAGAPASSMVTSGAKKVGKAMLQDLDLAMSGQGGSKVARALTSQVQPAYALRPKGGVYLGAQSAKDAPLTQIDVDLLEAIQGVDKSTDQGKAIVDFLDKKVRKYYQVDQGTPNDPVFKGILEGRIQSPELRPELVQRARQGDMQAYAELRDLYDQNLGLKTVFPEAALKSKDKYNFERIDEIYKQFKEAIEKQKPGEPSGRMDIKALGSEDARKWPMLYDQPGLNQMIKEAESNKLMSLLNKTDLPPHLRQAAREAEPVTYSWYGETSGNRLPQLVDIKDYLSTRTPAEIKNMGYADVVAKTQEWHTMLEQARKDPSKFSKKQLTQGTELFMPAKDDMKWLDVKSSDALSLEGNIMGHCVGGSNYCNAVNEGTKKIVSLRDKKGIPHVTIELAADNKNGVFDRVVQVKGTANNEAIKYFPQIDEFLTQYQSKLGNTKLRITEADRYLPESWRQLGQQYGRAPDFRRVDDRGAWVRHQNQDGEVIEEYILRGDPRFQDLNIPDVD